MSEPVQSSAHPGWLNRWLYVLALPAILLNYTILVMAVLLLGAPPRASLLGTSLNFIFIFPLALIAFVMLVAVRAQTRAQDLPQPLLAGMGAALMTLALASLTYVPTGIGPEGNAAPSSSFASRVLSLDSGASAIFSDVMQWGFAAVVLYSIVVCALQLRRLRVKKAAQPNRLPE